MAHLIGKKAFGDRLRRERRLKAVSEDRDIEQQEIAKTIGVDAATVGRWLRGETMPRDDDMFAELGRYFGVTPAWLRYGQEPRAIVEDVGAGGMRKIGERVPLPEPITSTAKAAKRKRG